MYGSYKHDYKPHNQRQSKLLPFLKTRRLPMFPALIDETSLGPWLKDSEEIPSAMELPPPPISKPKIQQALILPPKIGQPTLTSSRAHPQITKSYINARRSVTQNSLNKQTSRKDLQHSEEKRTIKVVASYPDNIGVAGSCSKKQYNIQKTPQKIQKLKWLGDQIGRYNQYQYSSSGRTTQRNSQSHADKYRVQNEAPRHLLNRPSLPAIAHKREFVFIDNSVIHIGSSLY